MVIGRKKHLAAQLLCLILVLSIFMISASAYNVYKSFTSSSISSGANKSMTSTISLAADTYKAVITRNTAGSTISASICSSAGTYYGEGYIYGVGNASINVGKTTSGYFNFYNAGSTTSVTGYCRSTK